MYCFDAPGPGRLPAHKKHRAGCAFVHRPHGLSATPLRVTRTALRNGFDLLASRARCNGDTTVGGRCDQVAREANVRNERCFSSDRPSR